METIAEFVTIASWSEILAVTAMVVSGGSIIAFAVAMIRDGIRNGW
jgi:hypothetical protein